MKKTKEKPEDNTQLPAAIPLAIVGIGCLFPRANNPEEYWKNIREGVDAISDIPASHWNPEDYFNDDKNAADMTYARRGGFINPVDFDPLLYGLSPNNIEATDTTQLLGMVVARQALLDAGYSTSNENIDGRGFDRNRTSVILGVTGTLELVIPLGARLGHPHWRKALAEAGVTDELAEEVVQRISDSYVPWQENSFPGLLGNVAAGRIANRFDLGGTNCVVDAACASSLSAIHMAALELYSGRSDMAISGGFDTFNDIFMYMCFSKTPALSPTGNSRPFDINGDGTILGEGLGAIVLKRLDDAKRDGDKIYAVLKGMGSSSDGRGNAIYAPSANGQTRALKNAYRDAGIRPTSIELVEAHGTGTRVGDAVEAEALSSVFREDRADGTWCALGSVKSMIGHTKAAAGVAGLIKIAMALKHKVLPPTIKIDKPLEILNPGKAPVYVNTHKRPWIADSDQPRRAAISAFGFGGSNFHAVLEEAEQDKTDIEWDGDVLIYALSGKSKKSVTDRINEIGEDMVWEELRYQAASSLQSFNYKDPCRLILVITAKTPLNELLNNVRTKLANDESKAWRLPQGAFFGSGNQTGKLAVLFPGQGSQYPDMLLDLACQFPQMQAALSEANRCFAETDPAHRLSNLIYPIPVFSDAERAQNIERLRATNIAQPAIGAVSIGSYHILKQFGIIADISAGHSFGELTALCAAGRFDSRDLLRLAIKRGELMQTDKDAENGSMLAVSASAAVLHEILEAEQLDLIIANNNAPKQVVLSGATDQIHRAIKVLEKRGLGARLLSVSAAFHSSFVADAEKPFARFLESVKFKAGKSPVFANSTAEIYPQQTTGARTLLASQLARPVEFVSQIENMYAEGAHTFIEVGPGSVLTGLVRSILGEREVTAIAMDASRGKNKGQFDLACCLAELAAGGHSLSLNSWDENFISHYQQRSEIKPAMTIRLSGANYVKPRAKDESSNKIQGNKKPVTKRTEPALLSTRPEPGTSRSESTVKPSTESSQLLKSTQQAIIALQKIQEQTAELHRQYLEGQETAQRSIQKLIEQQQQIHSGNFDPASIIGYIPDQELAKPKTVPINTKVNEPNSGKTTTKPSPGEQILELESLLLQVVSEKTGYPMEMLSLEMSLDTDLGIDSIKRVEILSALHEKLPGAGKIQPEDLGTFRLLKHIAEFLVTNTEAIPSVPVVEPVQVEGTPVGGHDYKNILFQVVSEKTGYPEDMLNLQMNLDTDLGIDSIKRVEILSAFQEKMPQAPQINPDELGRLQTLQQIADFMQANTPLVKTTNIEQTVLDTPQGNPALSQILLEVVAEKTGYPVDMLKLEMSLDTDLGIDSIKRVEILSAFQEQFPSAPAINPDQLASLQTLQQILGHMQDQGISENISRPEALPEPTMNSEQVGEEFTRSLLDVVADKTGYPVDMLKLEMNLDTDLGIDSIKRVEILSAYQEKMPEAPSINPDDMAKLQTLQQIVNYMGQEKTGTASTNNVQKPVSTIVSSNNIWRGVLKLVDLKADRQRLDFPSDGLIGVTDDGSELSGNLCKAFEEQGLQTCKLAISERQVTDLCALVIVVPAQFPDGFITDAFEMIQLHADSVQGNNSRSGLLACVTGLGGSFGIESLSDADPRCAAMTGLIKTAAKEWTNLSCRCIDVDYSATTDPDLAGQIADELLYSGPQEIGINKKQRRGVQLISQAATDSAINPDRLLEKNEMVVVSGGARGITADIADALARSYKVNLLLLGRSPIPVAEPAWLEGVEKEPSIKQAIMQNADQPLSPRQLESEFRLVMANREILRNLERIQALGVKAIYQSVDIRNKAEVKLAIDNTRGELGPVTGVVHGAGVIADKLIQDKTLEQFAQVYSTKVDGLEALLDATQQDDLKILVMFSSSTARFGRKGQSDYAAANEVLNKAAQLQSKIRPACRVLSLNWGPWDGGMVTPQLRKLFEAEGVGVIPTSAGSTQLIRELSVNGDVEVVILGSEPARDLLSMQQQISGPTPKFNTEMRVAFERVINIEDFPVLNSHIMNGKAVLPVAMIMEWFAHGAMHDNPGLVFKGVKELRVFKGVILESGSQIKLQILAGHTQERDGELEVAVELLQGNVLHAGARIILGNEHDRNYKATLYDLSGQYSVSDDLIYKDGRLFHGKSLHGISSINSCSAEGISGNARPAPHPSLWMQHPLRTGWITDPLVLDAAFQLMILWAFENLGAGSLPTRVGHYNQFQRSFPKDQTRINIQIESQSKHEVRAMIEFLNNKGELIARIDGYECVVDESLNDAFRQNQLAGEIQ